MTRFKKRKKFDLRKFINRTKNWLKRVRKFCRMHTLPMLIAVGIMVSVTFASYQNAYASGLEEMFYYTYFDLMSGLFAETGNQFTVKDEYYNNSDRVSAKQVWDNFCTWVEEKAKVAALPVEIVNKTVFDELKNLPDTVTAAGAKMSTALSELLAKILPEFASDSLYDNGNYPKISSFEVAAAIIAAVCGTSVSDVPEYGHFSDTYLQMFSDSVGKIYCIQTDWPLSSMDSGRFVYSGGGSSGGIHGITYDSTGYSSGDMIYGSSSYSWIVKNGLITSADGTTLSDYSKVKTVDDNTVYVPGVGYKTNWDIWKDIVNDKATTDSEEEAWNSRYDLDNDNKDDKEKKKKDNEKDKLPVAIPIIFPNKKPDSTEKDSEKDSEKGTEDVAPGGKPKPGSSEKPDSTQKDTEDKVTDSGQLPAVAENTGNWKRLFPFCIPWDIMSLVKSLKADKKAPRFTFKYTFKVIDYTWTVDVDMADYWKYIKIFRWGMTIFFIIGLFFLTVKFTTFVYRMGG